MVLNIATQTHPRSEKFSIVSKQPPHRSGDSRNSRCLNCECIARTLLRQSGLAHTSDAATILLAYLKEASHRRHSSAAHEAVRSWPLLDTCVGSRGRTAKVQSLPLFEPQSKPRPVEDTESEPISSSQPYPRGDERERRRKYNPAG